MAKVALLIGVSEYEPGLTPLPTSVKDVYAIRDVLLHPDMGGFVESEVVLLKNSERQDVETAIETLFSGRNKDDLVLLYFSGHGIKDDQGRLYLATRTTRKTTQGELIRSTSVSASFIHDRMTESRSRRQVVILDSCFSGAFAEGLSAKDDGTINIREQLGGEGRVVLTSSSSTQYSFEEQGQDLSIYTRFLVEGIKTGEADRDEDEFISIDELHEYVSQKVRELQPAMKPAIYAIREGFKIRLSKVAPVNPSHRYCKEVRRFIHRGSISFVGRLTLDLLRNRLGLDVTEAKAIEDEVLEPYRKDFCEKLQQYEQVFAELLERDETITENDRHDLKNLQQILGLRNEDTMTIEAQAMTQFKDHQEHLQSYEQVFDSAARQEYPLTEASKNHLRQMQQQLSLTTVEVEEIESRITAEVETYYQKSQEYERLFISATEQEYPLNELSRASLRQQQQQLGLKDGEILPIEAKITTKIESYHQKLRQYKQAFVKATHRKKYPDAMARSQLQQTRETLGLSENEIEDIESHISAEIEKYQVNLRRYQKEFTEATQQQYPLDDSQKDTLRQLRESLSLTSNDVLAVESSITSTIENYLEKCGQYRQVFAQAIELEYPVSEENRNDLCRLQKILELSDKEIGQIETQEVEQIQLDKLVSERKDLYTKLCDLLDRQLWKEADQETTLVLLKVSAKEDKGYFDEESILSIPRKDLHIVDLLWLKYSRRHFGFSIQRYLFESVNEDKRKFSQAVGWHGTSWWNLKSYRELIFSLAAPCGQFPTLKNQDRGNRQGNLMDSLSGGAGIDQFPNLYKRILETPVLEQVEAEIEETSTINDVKPSTNSPPPLKSCVSQSLEFFWGLVLLYMIAGLFFEDGNWLFQKIDDLWNHNSVESLEHEPVIRPRPLRPLQPLQNPPVRPFQPPSEPPKESTN